MTNLSFLRVPAGIDSILFLANVLRNQKAIMKVARWWRSLSSSSPKASSSSSSKSLTLAPVRCRWRGQEEPPSIGCCSAHWQNITFSIQEICAFHSRYIVFQEILYFSFGKYCIYNSKNIDKCRQKYVQICKSDQLNLVQLANKNRENWFWGQEGIIFNIF